MMRLGMVVLRYLSLRTRGVRAEMRRLWTFSFVPLEPRLKTVGLGKDDMTLDARLIGTPASLVVGIELGPKRCLRWSLVVAVSGKNYGDLEVGIDLCCETLNESDGWSLMQMSTETQMQPEVGLDLLVNLESWMPYSGAGRSVLPSGYPSPGMKAPMSP